MTTNYRAKIGAAYLLPLLPLIFIPAILLCALGFLAWLPYYITASAWLISALLWVCCLVILSAVMKTSYVLGETALIINFNPKEPLIIEYGKINSYEIKTKKTKIPLGHENNARNTARAGQTVCIKYYAADGRRKTVLISPEDQHNFVRHLEKKVDALSSPRGADEYDISETKTPEIEAFEDTGSFFVDLPESFFGKSDAEDPNDDNQ